MRWVHVCVRVHACVTSYACVYTFALLGIKVSAGAEIFVYKTCPGSGLLGFLHPGRHFCSLLPLPPSFKDGVDDSVPAVAARRAQASSDALGDGIYGESVWGGPLDTP